MNSKMMTNAKLSTTETKKTKTKTKQITRTGTESEKWRSYGVFSVGRGRERMGGKVQGRSINIMHKIDGKMLRVV